MNTFRSVRLTQKIVCSKSNFLKGRLCYMSHGERLMSYNKEDYCFITTPIFYVNAAPHIGHLYTTVLADAHARWNRLTGRQVLFSTGTDEHGLKIQQAANKSNRSPAEYCDNISEQFKRLFDSSNISHDDFIRTSEERHHLAVQTFWERLAGRGHIYKGGYEGWYSVSDEAFLTDDEVTSIQGPNGESIKVSVDSEQPVTWMREENYMFRLSSFTKQLHAWLDTGAIQPAIFEPMIRQLVDDLPDLSVSRQQDRLSWGIPVPGDDTQTIYVWLDALINYLTVAGFPGNMTMWPPTTQVIGKDILKFHAVYWPAFLLAAELRPPARLLCHSHWMVDGKKMSKSRGNIIDPFDRMSKYSVDGLRYFLLKEGTPHSDGNYADMKVIECINSSLVNTLGNLLQRCTALAVNVQQQFPPLDNASLEKYFSQQDRNMYESLKYLPDIVDPNYQNLTIYKALEHIMSVLHWANSLVQHHKPWKLVKQSNQSEHLQAVLHIAMETLRTCAIVLQPVVPSIAETLFTKLGVGEDERTIESVLKGHMLNTPRHLGHDRAVLLKRIKER